MLNIVTIDGYSKVFTDKELKDFVAINFRECFKSIGEETKL